MASLNPKPGSSTKRQRQTLMIAARRLGFSLDDVYGMICYPLRNLSAAEASNWIKRLSGKDLPNPPGQKPSVYKGRARPGTIRLITDDQADQIERLMLEYFDYDRPAAFAWLTKNFKVETVRELGTAKRAAEVIAALKAMHNRRELKGITP